ncbi:MAG: YgjV family protein [Clostridia bacterium]|nr:YgjV family protein [Clostridia bacterium]
MAFYIAQAISILTALVAVFMVQFKTMEKILVGQIMANVLTASTYFLLGGFSGAGICFIAILQSVIMFLLAKKEKQVKLPVILVFVGLYLVCSFLYYSSFVDVFSALAAVCFAFSIAAKNPKLSRRWYVLNPICWMIYDIATKAYGNFIIHAVVFISTFSAILRLDINKEGEK